MGLSVGPRKDPAGILLTTLSALNGKATFERWIQASHLKRATAARWIHRLVEEGTVQRERISARGPARVVYSSNAPVRDTFVDGYLKSLDERRRGTKMRPVEAANAILWFYFQSDDARMRAIVDATSKSDPRQVHRTLHPFFGDREIKKFAELLEGLKKRGPDATVQAARLLALTGTTRRRATIRSLSGLLDKPPSRPLVPIGGKTP